MIAQNNLSPVHSAQVPLLRDQSFEEPGLDDTNITRGLTMERMAREDLKWYLVNKYRSLLINKLTREDLEELQYYHRQQYHRKRGWNDEYVKKFILKLQEYVHDDILKHEIAGIDTLVTLMKPKDLQKETIKTVDR
jgi:hypothetical protein